MDLCCTWLTGPDAGGRAALSPGRSVVGRAHTADVRADDPALHPHHALLDVTPGGEVMLTQLAGRAPVRLDGRAIDGSTPVPHGARVEVGGSVLVIGVAPPEPVPAQRRGGALVRSPRAVPAAIDTVAPPVPDPPPAPERPGGLLPAGLGLVGAAVLATLVHQPMFFLFGAMGALVAAGGWIGQWLAGRRRHRKEVAAHHEAVAAGRRIAARVAEHERRLADDRTPGLPAALHTVRHPTAALWSRRRDHADAFAASLGLDAEGHPVAVDLGPQGRLAVVGPWAPHVARALLAQLVAACGPADLRLVVVTRRPDRWHCLRGLPHLVLADGSTAIVDGTSLPALPTTGLTGPAVLVVTDDPAALATRTSAVRRLVADGAGLLAVLDDGDGVPHVCTAVLTTTLAPAARWVADATTTLLPVPVLFAGLGAQAMAWVARALGDLTDPEDPLAAEARLPREVSLGELLGADACTAAGVVATWHAAGEDPPLRTPIGRAADGVVDLDLGRDGPHGLLAGTTGAGKSELLRSLVAGLAAGCSPRHLAFVLVDYKGGATFDACAHLPHVAGVVTDLDGRLADRVLRSLHAELRRREAVLRDHGVGDLPALRSAAPGVVLPRLVVVVDEFAALVAEQPDFLHALVGVAQRGRSLGVHLLLATQRPNGVISDDIRANTELRLALRLLDTADAVDVVGAATPAQLPRGVPGRGVLRLGHDGHVTFQTARCTAPLPGGETELTTIVRAIAEAARQSGAATVAAPWQPPLPALLTGEGVPDDAIGLVDDPDHQRVLPLRWRVDDGAVLVAGSAGTGVSTTLRTLAVQALADDEVEVYVLQARNGGEHDGLAAHPRAEVVCLDDPVRVLRLLHRVRRRADSGRPTVLMIDGLDTVRRALDDPATAAEYDELDGLLANGPVVLAGVEQPSSVPAVLLARCPHRWVLHLHDPHDATVLGVAARDVPAPAPGRVWLGEAGLEAQLLAPGERSLPHDSRSDAALATITGLAGQIDAASLRPPVVAGGIVTLPIGVEVVTGDDASLAWGEGDHVLVAGPARSGRSTALALLAAQWQAAHPGGVVTAVLPRRSAVDTRLAGDLDRVAHRGGLHLVLVDDAELVDDPQLAALLATPGVTVVAAGRTDALRQSYGHWTAAVRRSRIGLVLAGGSDLDGDLFGIALPRRLPVRARPGLAWLVGSDGPVLAQLAWHPPALAVAG